MTDFATASDVVSALAAASNGGSGCRQEFYKTTLTVVANFDYSGWMMTGSPTVGVAPTTWAHPTAATAGTWAPKYANSSGGTNRLLLTDIVMTNAGQSLILRDRIGHMGGMSGIVTTAQTVAATLTAPAADGRCDVSGSDVEWFLEWYTATGATGVNATVAVTYDDASTGNVVVALPATVPAYRMYRIQPAVAGRTIKGITSVTLSATTGTAGNFGVTATKKLATSFLAVAGYNDTRDWARLAMPKIGSNACLFGTFWTTTTTLGTVLGTIIAGGH